MWFETYNYIVNNYDTASYQHLVKLLPKGVFLDTAPLFILIVGHYDGLNRTNFIGDFQSKSKEKDRRYGPYDYKYLLAFLNSCGLGKRYNLFITPHVFTEFIKHLWEVINNPKQFEEVLQTCFKNKWYIKERQLDSTKIIAEAKFLEKRLEIGDVSLTIVDNEKVPFRTILTDDGTFARIADKEYGFLAIYYDEVRNGTFALGSKNIPCDLLKEPVLSMGN